MHREIMESISAALRERPIPPDDAAWFSDPRYAAVPLSTGRFHPIMQDASHRRMTFVDGGNLEILKAPDFSLQFIRTYATTYQHDRRISSALHEQYALIHAVRADGSDAGVIYKVKLFPLKKSLPVDEASLVFDPMDPAFRHGPFRADISRMGDAVRDILEIEAARIAAGGFFAGDCVVRDGTLQATHALQERHLSRLFVEASARGVAVASVAKTCDLFCRSGRSLLGAIAHLAERQQHRLWHYAPLVEIRNEKHPAIMTLARLHPRSSHIFRCEVHHDHGADLPAIMARLARNSKDPIFLGYPYGLVEADRFARVSRKEGEYLAMRFMAQCKDWPAILSSINAANAHTILDAK